MQLKEKYRIEDWIINRDTLTIGDRIAFYCNERNMEIQAMVIVLPRITPSKINYRESSSGLFGSIDFYDNIVYKIDGAGEEVVGCTCGAKHTSNPAHHLFYCRG